MKFFTKMLREIIKSVAFGIFDRLAEMNYAYVKVLVLNELQTYRAGTIIPNLDVSLLDSPVHFLHR